MTRPKAIRPVNIERNFVRILVYGQPGTGKSVLAGTSPKALILASDAEETISCARWESTAEMWVVPDYQELTEAYEYIRHEGYKEYDWIWLDNGTLFQEQGMDQIMRELVEEKPERNPWVPDKPQYLINQNRLGSLIRQFKSLPVHFGLTAHVMSGFDLRGNEIWMPMFQGGQGTYSQKMCGYMNIVGYLSVGKEQERKLRVGKSARMYAKDRYSALGSEVINPTIPKIMEAIEEKVPTIGQRKPRQPVAKKATGTIKKGR